MEGRAEGRGDLRFDPTRWDLVRLAAGEDPSDYARRQAARALNQLCEIYRAPVVAYLNRWIASQHDAEDLAQEFFSRRISAEMLAGASEHRGRFRALLLVTLKNFLRDQISRQRAEKRGGKIQFVQLNEAIVSTPGAAEAGDPIFDRCWAQTVVERALATLRRFYSERGEAATFDALLPFISDLARDGALEPACRRLGTSLKATHVRLSRLRAAYAQHVRQELARTVSSPEEIEPETRYLLDVLAASR